mmetsp:Transcript_2159/g.5450  ORF Transcript_2159/g.5450 Transcript_2159/m.5450 type:complete len:181 (-) Transcript_2159:2694-3236(-)|eukprot:CAMPEP_0204897148 /NCGR_PEP_ID=MMETSP1397-20131031/575_1 /ASSEMBLY_ACC=CAM_ASM_000891 /TAXON_ID=49980 /ORGANISM="Climacostomum Climacostomum virens, Strain Stock W-24" /LENGTH=180 /DNA_ID=CAMNT_0052064859 /DNA_START=21 /DNA_END=563 /DNA_ORIENTATION=-
MNQNENKRPNLRGKAVQFNSVQLRGDTLAIGDTCRVKIEGDEESICTIMGISSFKGKTTLKVRWFYTPEECGVKAECIGVAEVFDSPTFASIPLESLIEKVYVMPVKEYNFLDRVDDCSYYCRAQFDGKRLIPPISDWESMCVCHRVINPDVPMLQCDNCLEFFHEECIALPFVCPICFI